MLPTGGMAPCSHGATADVSPPAAFAARGTACARRLQAQSHQTLFKGLFLSVGSSPETAELTLVSAHQAHRKGSERIAVLCLGKFGFPPRGESKTRLTSVFQAEHRTMTAFILAVIVNSYNTGQVSATAAPPSLHCRGLAPAALFWLNVCETVSLRRGLPGARGGGLRVARRLQVS